MTDEEWRAECLKRFMDAARAAASGGDYGPGNALIREIAEQHGKEQAVIARRELINYVERGKI